MNPRVIRQWKRPEPPRAFVRHREWSGEATRTDAVSVDSPPRWRYFGGMKASPRKKPIVRICACQLPCRVPRKRLTQLAAFVAKAEGARLAEVDVAIVDNASMTGLNRRFLNHRGSTDVLSFDLSDSPAAGISAEIVLCGDVAVRQGKLLGCSPQRELMLYLVHGLLHLMGYEDSSIRGSVKMGARQEELLREFLSQRRKRRISRRRFRPASQSSLHLTRTPRVG